METLRCKQRTLTPKMMFLTHAGKTLKLTIYHLIIKTLNKRFIKER